MKNWGGVFVAVVATAVVVPDGLRAESHAAAEPDGPAAELSRRQARRETLESLLASGEFTQGAYATAYDAESSEGENPTNVDFDLNQSFPQPNAVFKTNVPIKWFKWKKDLYENTGVKLGFSYQSLYQTTSDSRTPDDSFWGGWLLVEAKWDAINRDKDFEGALVVAVDWKHNIAGKEDPFFSFVSSGSVWPNDIPFFSWDPWASALFWEQELRKQDNFVFRVGTQTAAQFIDFSRYKDSRVSFTGSPFTGSFETVPTPAPGLGASFRWNTADPSEFYIVGTVNDINADPQDVSLVNWDTAWDEGEFFYALEFGKNWRRNPRDFDHFHVLLTYVDDRSTPILPGVPLRTEGGFGVKVSGEKQWGRVVGFASYGYNEAEGGPFGATLVKHAVTAGFAVNRPLGINGEVGVGAAWAEPIEGLPLIVFPQNQPLKNQYGLEMYWRALITNDLWLTPGLQVVFNPTYNPNTDAVVLPSLKFRFFL